MDAASVDIEQLTEELFALALWHDQTGTVVGMLNTLALQLAIVFSQRPEFAEALVATMGGNLPEQTIEWLREPLTSLLNLGKEDADG